MGAEVIITARNAERLRAAAAEIGALSSAAFDAADDDALDRFFAELPNPIDHVLVTGVAVLAPLAELDFDRARKEVNEHILLPLRVARNAVGKVRGRRLVALHERDGRAPTRDRNGHPGCAHRGGAGARREPRARARADPHQPDRTGLRRHAPLRVDPRRRSR